MDKKILPAARQKEHLKPIAPSDCSGSGYSTSSDSDYDNFHEVKKKKRSDQVRSEALEKKIKSNSIDLENSYESFPSEKDLDADDDISKMQVDHSPQKKSNSPSTSKASSINSQFVATPTLPPKINVPPIINDDPLSAAALMKTLSYANRKLWASTSLERNLKCTQQLLNIIK
ncbi:hypothetical protein AVEN_147507-1 [Araneus ventricosus]|uniref:Uncharacterized protein n=1 Tax=Araneus ventricosus TaxID=182803 RepID=A0A4Y2JNN6_ARAVE|nr:hypothetical protein AVEN_147507-1 [Araneus ventricosus]